MSLQPRLPALHAALEAARTPQSRRYFLGSVGTEWSLLDPHQRLEVFRGSIDDAILFLEARFPPSAKPPRPTEETEEEWVKRMVALEDELGPFPPDGATGGAVARAQRAVRVKAEALAERYVRIQQTAMRSVVLIQLVLPRKEVRTLGSGSIYTEVLAGEGKQWRDLLADVIEAVLHDGAPSPSSPSVPSTTP